MNPEELDELLARAAPGMLSPADAARLLAAARADGTLRRQLARHFAIERLLYTVSLDADGSRTAREVALRLRGERIAAIPAPGFVETVAATARRWLWWRRAAWIGAAAAVLLALASGAYWYVEATRPVVTLARVEGVKWKGTEPRPVLPSGTRLKADRGLFELRFTGGSRVVVEAPADLEIQGPGRVFLYLGRAVAHVPEQARGFILDSPRGRLIDLGTEFGVSVAPNGNTEVHVLDGMVEASLNKATPVLLRESEALRATHGEPMRKRADEGAFVTALPPVSNRPPGFIHWSFDDAADNVFANTGRNLGDAEETLLFPHFLGNARSAGPQRQPGRFGQALEFDGFNDYAESPFRGITGGQARSIVFWVKIPRDFRTTQGYGIVSWGDIHQEGAAWQVSANPAEMAGELGRLRVGTKNGYVVGTTDLRDDRWHHCAVVMYGGERPTTGTHVLLYVDGLLEPSPRKSVQEIATVASAQHGLWLGRNLAFHDDSLRSLPSGAFFRGHVDEVYIFDGALSHREIEALMRNNQPPDAP